MAISPNPDTEVPAPSHRIRGAARARIVQAALSLFAEHGVSGTSLQMIADALGVTKAAVYHQFRTKEAIVFATAEEPLRLLEEAVKNAEAEESPTRQHEVLLAQMIELAVHYRLILRNLQGDPGMVRFVAEHKPIHDLMEREYRLLMGSDSSAEARVRAAMVSTVLAGAAGHPLVADLDDDTLRAQLLDLVRRFMGFPPQRGGNTRQSPQRGQASR